MLINYYAWRHLSSGHTMPRSRSSNSRALWCVKLFSWPA
jgi:hypothetical protein